MAVCELSISLFVLYFLCIFSNVASLASSTDDICNLTPHPTFCKSNSPSNYSQGDIHEYGRFFSNKSYSSSKNFHSLVSKYLKSPSNFSESTLLALQDCYLIGDLNIDLWAKTRKNINSTNTLSTSKAEYFLTLISATLTNLDTCLDSLQQTTSSSTLDEDLLSHLSNGTKFYSISLAMFKKGWASNINTERKLLETNSYKWEQRLYELIGRRGRKLLQSAPDNVNVSQIVVVNPDGSGNYTSINDAVNAAPNNTVSSNGFFVIHVVAGLYEEYVSIPKNNKYLMMIGDGINQTIITGNRSVAGGWTTFNSATFGKLHSTQASFCFHS